MASEKQAANLEWQPTQSKNRIKGLWHLMAGFRLKYVGAALSLGVASISRTATYLLLRQFVDSFLEGAGGAGLLPLIALSFVLLAAVQGFFTFTSGKLAASTAEGVVKRLRDYIYDHIQRLPYSFHDKTPTGELIQRATSDVDAIRRFFQDQAIGLGRIILLFIINLTALLLLHWKLALLSVVVVPPVVVLSYFFFRRMSKTYEVYQEQDAVLSTRLQENLTGVRVVKAFARQQFEQDSFEKENWKKFEYGRRFFLMHAMYWPVSDILCGFQMLAGFMIGAFMTIDGAISIGTYLAYSGMVIYIIFPIRNLGRLIVQMSTGLVSYGRVETILSYQRETLTEGDTHPEAGIRGELEFRNLGFSYEENDPILEDISFHVQPGQVVGLLGSTGSGKTTLVNLLPRFYDVSTGTILLDGVPLESYPRGYLRSQIGIVEQEPFLFSRTIRENITYGVGRSVSEEEINAAVEAAAIQDMIQALPDGYDTIVGEKGVTLSGGQKQRIAIARTLLKDPRILILDDSTSSVDAETETQIRAALERLMEGRTTLIIAHRVQSVRDADLIIVMENGRIVQHGTHEALLKEDGMYQQIYRMQTTIEAELEQEVSGV